MDSNGNVYVTGRSEGNLGGNTNAGETDIFVWKVIDTPTPTLPLLCTDPGSLTYDFGTVPEGQSRKWTFNNLYSGEILTMGTFLGTIQLVKFKAVYPPSSDSSSFLYCKLHFSLIIGFVIIKTMDYGDLF